MPKQDTYEHTVIAPESETTTGAVPNMPHLRVIYPRGCDQRCTLGDEAILIGRGEDADFVLDDTMISRAHCRISRTDEGFLVEDLGSTNGTIIDGHRVESSFLHPHSRLKVGPYVMKIEYIAPAELSREDQLFAQANTDALTGIPNRRWLLDQGLNILGSFHSGDAMLSAALIDLDHFKSVNDTWGHPVGDAVLSATARCLQGAKREVDLLGRYGGEEFLVLMPETTAEEAKKFCERLRAAVAENVVEFEDQSLQVTISIGVCGRQRDQVGSLDQLIKLADQALYRAKNGGRNKVVGS